MIIMILYQARSKPMGFIIRLPAIGHQQLILSLVKYIQYRPGDFQAYLGPKGTYRRRVFK